MTKMKKVILCLTGLFVFAAWHSGALAASEGFRVCNKTDNLVGVALGYKQDDQFVSEGWWNLEKGKCETLLQGSLVSRFYYVYAIDYQAGGEWSGTQYLCTNKGSFTIQGNKDCIKRGFERTGFMAVDIKDNQRDWTVLLESPQ